MKTEIDGFTLEATIEDDDSRDAPWDQSDMHGPVSGWTDRPKKPGERVLARDRSSYRYYDVSEAIKIARRDGWDSPPYKTGSKGEQAVRAVEADFKHLRDWCNDEWRYIGVVVSVSKNGIMLDENAASLWGIESYCEDYIKEVADELYQEAVEVGKAALVKLRVW